jgi:hypothetical protein
MGTNFFAPSFLVYKKNTIYFLFCIDKLKAMYYTKVTKERKRSKNKPMKNLNSTSSILLLESVIAQSFDRTAGRCCCRHVSQLHATMLDNGISSACLL